MWARWTVHAPAVCLLEEHSALGKPLHTACLIYSSSPETCHLNAKYRRCIVKSEPEKVKAGVSKKLDPVNRHQISDLMCFLYSFYPSLRVYFF